LTPTGWHAARDADDAAAHGIARPAHSLDEPDHFLRRDGVRATNNVRLDVRALDGIKIHVGDDPLDLFHEGEHLDAVTFAQDLLCDATGGHATNGLARAGASTALPVADAEFRLIRVIGVGGPKFRRHLRIRFGTRVLVFNPHTDGSAERFAFESAGQDLDDVALLARGDNSRLTRPAAI